VACLLPVFVDSLFIIYVYSLMLAWLTEPHHSIPVRVYLSVHATWLHFS